MKRTSHLKHTPIMPDTSYLEKTVQDKIACMQVTIYLITFTTAEKQAVLGVAQQSEAPNEVPLFYPQNHDIPQTTTPGTTCPTLCDKCVYVPQDYEH